jgi:transcriptional regulator with GAF, ATPase, and Fis domain
MVPALQAKLLRFLEEKTFKRVGGASDIKVDVRVVAATNRKLDDEVAKGRFRSDLFYRLNVLPIAMPPLRSHPEDIPVLVDFFVDGFNREFRRNILGATSAALTFLQSYGWPGNVRELRNVIERAMLLSEGDRLGPADFAALTVGPGPVDGLELPATGIDLEELERSFVVQALRRSGGNQTKAAALLGLNRDQIRYRIEKFGLSVSS